MDPLDVQIESLLVQQEPRDRERAGKGCNREAKNCILRRGFSNKNDPKKPNYYCAARHQYVRIPGHFSNRQEAEKQCDYDHSKDCAKPKNP